MSAPAFDERGLPAGQRLRPELEFSPRQVEAMLGPAGGGGVGPKPLLVDVRTQAEWDIVRLPGAMLIPLHELEKRADEVRDALEEGGSRPIVVYCHHGVRSLKAAAMLQAVGLPGAKSLAGGLEQWALAIDPRMPRYEREGSICRVIAAR